MDLSLCDCGPAVAASGAAYPGIWRFIATVMAVGRRVPAAVRAAQLVIAAGRATPAMAAG